jgi:hypothetical protein
MDKAIIIYLQNHYPAECKQKKTLARNKASDQALGLDQKLLIILRLL